MEVDTGAAVSIITRDTQQSLFPKATLHQSDALLRTYTGEGLTVLGELRGLTVQYENQTVRNLSLIVVQSGGPSLLGRNWLEHIKLNWKKVGAVTLQHGPLQQLTAKYRDVFAEGLGTIKTHRAKLTVKAGVKPKFFKPRRVPFAMREAVEEELERLEQEGVLVKVKYSNWAAPIVCVPKKDGKVRICGDYKVTVNGALDVDQYPLPHPEDIFATLAGGKQFTILDLSHAYNQLLLDDESRELVTINTHHGLYQYTRLPFGIASAPAIFQRVMDTILQDIPGAMCYIDDIIVTGKDEEDHLRNLAKVCERLEQHGIQLKQAKCEFMQSSVEYLGYRIDAEGLHATNDKLQAIVEAPPPKNVHELRSFLGMLNYYGKFIPNLASIIQPLNALLGKDCRWNWSGECNKSFKLAKDKLISPNVLVHYDPKLPIKLAADASAYGVGAVISHVMPDKSEHFLRT